MSRSTRPDSINVIVADSDPRWLERLKQDLHERLGANVTVAESCEAVHINGKCPHVVVIGNDADPDFMWLKEIRQRYSNDQLPVIVANENDESQIEASRAGANAIVDRKLHNGDNAFLEKLVYGLAHE